MCMSFYIVCPSLRKLPPEVFFLKSVLKNFQIFKEKYVLETPTQVYCREYCKVFKNTYFEIQLRMKVLNIQRM